MGPGTEPEWGGIAALCQDEAPPGDGRLDTGYPDVSVQASQAEGREGGTGWESFGGFG